MFRPNFRAIFRLMCEKVECTIDNAKCTSEFLNKINYVYLIVLENIDSCCIDLYSSLKQIALLRKTDSLESLIVTVLFPFTVSFCRWVDPSSRKTDGACY